MEGEERDNRTTLLSKKAGEMGIKVIRESWGIHGREMWGIHGREMGH
jgi:hypothetical protein